MIETSTEAPTARVLIVDDEESVRLSLQAFLDAEGYETHVLADAEGVSDVLLNNEIDVVVSDIIMPRISGVELLKKIRVTSPNVQVIMMTGEPTVSTATDAVRGGACDYLTKPVCKHAILRSVSTAALVKHLDDERHRLTLENERYRRNLEQLVDGRTRELQDALSEAQNLVEGTIMAMGKVVETRDPYTAGHQERVAELSKAIAEKMRLSQHNVDAVWHAGLVHDLGKIGVPAEILNTPAMLSDEAMALVKQHSEMGARILENIPFPWQVAQCTLEHHERIDGSGYPYGLSGDRISIEGRIIGVADVVESMSSHRPYRPALGLEVAMEEIEKNAGSKYDSDVSSACLALFREEGFRFSAPKWQTH